VGNLKTLNWECRGEKGRRNGAMSIGGGRRSWDISRMTKRERRGTEGGEKNLSTWMLAFPSGKDTSSHPLTNRKEIPVKVSPGRGKPYDTMK